MQIQSSVSDLAVTETQGALGICTNKPSQTARCSSRVFNLHPVDRREGVGDGARVTSKKMLAVFNRC